MKRAVHPNSLDALAKHRKPFKPGESGNPGGRVKGSPKISNVYARLLAMTPDEFRAFKPTNGAEDLAYNLIKHATSGKPAVTLAALRR